MTTIATPGANAADLDEFTARNALAMRGRLDHGAEKFGEALGWRDADYPYHDRENFDRLERAVAHLYAALAVYRSGSVGEDELRKRAADVANQAFMPADPARLTSAQPTPGAARQPEETT